MSKLKEFIQIRQGNSRIPAEEVDLISTSFTEKFDSGVPDILPYYTAWNSEVRLFVRQFIRENTSGEELIELKRHIRELFIEEIFGEFRKPLLKLRRIIYERKNTELALKELDLIYKQMFE